jgi:hypothetical protein
LLILHSTKKVIHLRHVLGILLRISFAPGFGDLFLLSPDHMASGFFLPIGTGTGTHSIGKNNVKIEKIGNLLPLYLQSI